jgi:cold shock CspA family protein/ribosome-associated translation inhibitor RaiA
MNELWQPAMAWTIFEDSKKGVGRVQLPLQITFRHMEPSPALEARIRQLAARLDKFSGDIMHGHVIVEAPPRHQHQGGLFEVRIDLTVPEKEIATRRTHPIHHSHEDVYVALRDAFRAARRQLEDYERERRSPAKTHVGPPLGRVCELRPERNFGRIETDDGRLIYFHRNSVREGSFEQLSIGTRVRFNEEPGDLGPQASTVHVLA